MHGVADWGPHGWPPLHTRGDDKGHLGRRDVGDRGPFLPTRGLP